MIDADRCCLHAVVVGFFYFPYLAVSYHRSSFFFAAKRILYLTTLTAGFFLPKQFLILIYAT